LNFSESKDGLVYSNNSVLVFFGKKFCDLDRLKNLFPKINFRGLNQTHANTSIKSVENSDSIEADAHWTQEKNVGLLIRTADCMPIMIYQSDTKSIVAIHSGWRGVANRITPLAIDKLSPEHTFNAYIGPHIMQKSFEVKNDTKELLLKSLTPETTSPFPLDTYLKTENEKIYIDLQKIISKQLSEYKIANIQSVNRDTKSDPEFFSYRRDREEKTLNNQRNLNFICLLN
jgi:polyphenol oxidase